MIRNDANVTHIPDGHALQVHWAALLQAFSVVEISVESNLGSEHADRAAQKKNQNTQGHRRDCYGYSDPEF